MKRVDLEAALASYQERLLTVLRGFAKGEDFLAHWVPDDDPAESVLGVLDAARTAGLDSVAVDFGAATAAAIDLARLETSAGRYGTVRLAARPDGVSLEVDLSRAPAPVEEGPRSPAPAKARPRAHARGTGAPAKAHAPREALLEAARSPTHEGALAEAPGLVRLEASESGATLAIAVDPARHDVRAAAHRGGVDPALRGCLDLVCRILEGRPIQEGADHAVLRVEHATRPGGAPPVSGIVSTENAGGPFALVERLVRAVLAEYRATTGFAATENRFRPEPSAHWARLDDAARLEAVRTALAEICGAMGLGPDAAEVLSISDRVRVRLAISPAIPSVDRRTLLGTIERALQDRLDPTISVELEARPDASKLRRL